MCDYINLKQPSTPCPEKKRPKTSEKKKSIPYGTSIEAILLGKMFMSSLGVTAIKINNRNELCNLYNLSYYGWAPSSIEYRSFSKVLFALSKLGLLSVKFNELIIWHI